MTENQEHAHAKQPLILQVKLEDLQLYTHKALFQFPKNERFLLCADIKNSVAECMHLTIRMKKKYTKKTTLQEIDIELDYLRTLIRTAHRCGYITEHKWISWVGRVDECGKILGGLLKFYAGRKS
ncbi:MAG: diversity-generating retroelement protein Avd [Selenomonadaceae bacterium]|nr:diversity-generating retroelement protein Avd [Selenomonadaceae bacterium]